MTMTFNMTTLGDNAAALRDALKAELGKLGAMSIASDVARPTMALRVVAAITDGIPGADDVASVYGDYAAGRAKAQGKNVLAQGLNSSADSEKVQISKLRQIVDMAKLPLWSQEQNGTHMLDRVVTLRGNMVGGDQKLKSPYDAFVDVSRAQLAQPDTPLTDEQIEAIVCKGEPADKSDLERLIEVYKKAYKVAEALPGNVALAQAVTDLADAIAEAGGETPPMTAEEKKAAKAREFLAKYEGK